MPVISLAEPLSLPFTFSLVILVTFFFFIWRFKKSLLFGKSKMISKIAPNIPTILITGTPKSGKSSLFFQFAHGAMKMPLKDGSFQYSRVVTPMGFPVQIIDSPRYLSKEDIEALKPLINSIIYIFDVSKNSLPIETQIDFFHKLGNFFEHSLILPIINEKKKADKLKLRELRKRLSNDIPRFSIKDGNTKLLRNLLFQQFL